ncbi:DUF4870 domain-containing protein [Dehalogenimonas etheniformans]|uniref:Uncharacterized protein n=1 Tax=Dehalogenimonas etheniformans TaxID=1536648 RepID=A0A2P5P4R6_9CHLR|nr:hypothetical protein [Dehalogenimonas etheniformans]PPD57292.1 hypothetical protein JP09_009595 [Dehalogenimonas etheniformans]QNT77008.1 hypothetical protein HX448_10145 [Dehalogenimonas etheniformans]
MEISPEERRKIYEEEKARIERESQTSVKPTDSSQKTSTGLSPNIEAFLCYLGMWVTGVIFLIIEQKNAKVRFHATQSILIFGPLSVAGWILGWIPVSGGVISFIVSIVALVLWIVLMVKTYRGEEFEIPVVSNLARQLTGISGTSTSLSNSAQTASAENASKPATDSQKYVPGSRAGRLVGSSISIAWCSALLIFMNFYHQYIAIYHGSTSNGVTIWTRDPILNQDFHQWLPILNVALFVGIAGNIMTIIWDKYLLREPVKMVIDIFSLAAIISLINIFPFDFSSFPDAISIDATRVGVRVVLILAAVGTGIGILVRFIKFVANLSTGKTSYHP